MRRHLAILCLSATLLEAMAFESSGSSFLWNDENERISGVFEALPNFPESSFVKAAAWSRVKGRLMAAAVCVSEPPPRLGCAEFAGTLPRSVAASVVGPDKDKGDIADMARILEGRWEGEGYVLRVDGERGQANVDPNSPFNWQRFVVRHALDGAVVFAVGSEVFEAWPASNSVTLTSTSFRGERVLRRS